MTYFRISPHPLLRPFVESYGIQESGNFSSDITCILPTGCMNILFHYGDRFQCHIDGEILREPEAYVSGQRTEPLYVSAEGRTGIVIISLYPWALPAFTPIPAIHLAGQSVPLEALFDNQLVSEALNQVVSNDDHQQKITAVEKLLLKMLNVNGVDPRLISAIKLINKQFGSTHISELAKQQNISPRQLNRIFLKGLGMGAKKFAAINRFQHALAFKQSGLSTQDVLSNTGYFDQAHLIHDFQKIGETTPERVFSNLEVSPLMRKFNPGHQSKPMTLFYNTMYLQ